MFTFHVYSDVLRVLEVTREPREVPESTQFFFVHTSIGFSFYLTPDGDEAAHLTCAFSLLVDQKSPMRP